MADLSRADLLAAAVDRAEVGLAILGAGGKILYWNRWLSDRSGVDDSTAIGSRLSDLFPQLEGSRLNRMVTAAIDHGSTGEIRPALGGSPLPLRDPPLASLGNDSIQQSLTVMPLAEMPHHCLLQVSDLTNMVYRERLLLDQANNLERTNADLERLGYIVSHDLRAPLTSVQMLADLMSEELAEADNPNEAHQEYMDQMKAALGRMDRLILDLLEYSRIGWSEASVQDVDLSGVVRDVAANLRAQITEVDATVEVGELPVVEGDPTLLLQLLQNLTSNALKFAADAAPVVQIGSRSLADKHNDGAKLCEIYVTDNGIGIDPRFQERVFEVFRRLHSDDQYEGTGIGLAVCKRIVEQHGGSVRVESSPGKGSTFYVTLRLSG